MYVFEANFDHCAGVPLGLFNFKDERFPSEIKSIHAMLEKVLQSEKNESLQLDDNFQVKIKLLGILNMTHIRKTKKRILKRLNMENHGDDDGNSIVGTIGIPNDFNFGEGAENILKNQCLTLSIILGCCIIYGKYLKKDEFKTKGSVMNDIN